MCKHGPDRIDVPVRLADSSPLRIRRSGNDYKVHRVLDGLSIQYANRNEGTGQKHDDFYSEAIEHCRSSFPDLRILSGLEIGEPHWHADRSVCARTRTVRPAAGSLHCLPDRDRFQEPGDLYVHRDARQVVRDYLAEVAVLVAAAEAFSVLAHIDTRFVPGRRSWVRSTSRSSRTSSAMH